MGVKSNTKLITVEVRGKQSPQTPAPCPIVTIWALGDHNNCTSDTRMPSLLPQTGTMRRWVNISPRNKEQTLSVDHCQAHKFSFNQKAKIPRPKLQEIAPKPIPTQGGILQARKAGWSFVWSRSGHPWVSLPKDWTSLSGNDKQGNAV